MTCFPSSAPIQFGKFHLVQNRFSMCFQSSSIGACIYIGCSTCQMASHTLYTAQATVDVPRRNLMLRVKKESPVARKLNNNKHSFQ